MTELVVHQKLLYFREFHLLLFFLLFLLQALQVVVLSGVAVSEAAAARLKRIRPKLQVKATGKKACTCQ
jgi:hypothetical protein